MVKKVKKTCSKKTSSQAREQNKKCIDCNEWLLGVLQDQEVALGYLDAAMLDEDQRVFISALKDVLMAQKGGITGAAKKTGLNRQSLCRMFDSKSKLSWKNLKAIFDLLGLQVRLEYKKQDQVK